MTEPFEDFRPSRSAAKRQARHVEDVARALLDLGANATAALGWDASLLEELELASKTRGHGARKRQIKHLAAKLRREPEAVEMAEKVLAAHHGHQKEQVRDFHELEQIRDRLCNPETLPCSLQEAEVRYPACDTNHLEQLARNFLESGDRRAYREIFRHLRAAAEKGRP